MNGFLKAQKYYSIFWKKCADEIFSIQKIIIVVAAPGTTSDFLKKKIKFQIF